MRTFTKEELKEILENHKHWLREDCSGWEGMRANLRNADLRNADLRNADLSNADLSNADLGNAYLGNAYLRNADLRNAHLRNADLGYADLSYAHLRNADLSYADLSYADLRKADLSYADLSYAHLRKAYLRKADLRNADLSYAHLRNADLGDAKNIPYIPYSCPDFGTFIGFKKASGKIVALEIPEDARRCSATGRKCRCDKAKVIGIYDYEHKLLEDKAVVSSYDSETVYVVGEMVYPDRYDENRWNECSHGIHFFINFQEAVNYNN